MGNEDYPSVRTGNIICARTLIVFMVACAMGCWTILEQPKNSLMEGHPGFQHFLRMIPHWRALINMKEFGGPTQKPTWLYSNRPEIEDLHEYRPLRLPTVEHSVEMVVHYKDAKGQDRIKGGRDLKNSQSYPVQFLGSQLS